MKMAPRFSSARRTASTVDARPVIGEHDAQREFAPLRFGMGDKLRAVAHVDRGALLEEALGRAHELGRGGAGGEAWVRLRGGARHGGTIAEPVCRRDVKALLTALD